MNLYSVIFTNSYGKYSLVVGAQNAPTAIRKAMKEVGEEELFSTIEAVLIYNHSALTITIK